MDRVVDVDHRNAGLLCGFDGRQQIAVGSAARRVEACSRTRACSRQWRAGPLVIFVLAGLKVDRQPTFRRTSCSLRRGCASIRWSRPWNGAHLHAASTAGMGRTCFELRPVHAVGLDVGIERSKILGETRRREGEGCNRAEHRARLVIVNIRFPPGMFLKSIEAAGRPTLKGLL